MTERILHLNQVIIGNNASKSLFFSLMGAIVGTFVIYSFLMGTLIYAIVEKRNAETASRELRATIGTLQAEYLALSGTLNMNLAKEMGFTETKAQVFVSRIGEGESLTYSGN